MLSSHLSFFHLPSLAALLLGVTLLPLLSPTNGRPQSFSDLVRSLHRGSAADKVNAIGALVSSGAQRALPHLKDALRDADARVRRAAEQGIWALWQRSGDDRTDALLAGGIRLLEQRRLEDAVRAFSEVIGNAPKFAEGYNKRATVLYLLRQFDKSIRDCEATLRLNPDHFGALSGAGLCYVGLKRYRDALSYFRRAVAANPNLDSIKRYIRELQDALGQTPL